MANTIKIRRSATPGATPTTGQLSLGELALNTADCKLYAKRDNGSESIVELSATRVGSGATGLRNITTSTSDPTGGSDGDIWIKYTA
jgi:hypothetical protein